MQNYKAAHEMRKAQEAQAKKALALKQATENVKKTKEAEAKAYAKV